MGLFAVGRGAVLELLDGHVVEPQEAFGYVLLPGSTVLLCERDQHVGSINVTLLAVFLMLKRSRGREMSS